MCNIEARRDDVVQLGGENVVLHEGELAQDLDLTKDLAGGVLVVESIADLFDGDLFVGCAMAGLNHSSETALTTDLEELEVGLDGGPELWKLHHLSTFISEKATLLRKLAVPF